MEHRTAANTKRSGTPWYVRMYVCRSVCTYVLPVTNKYRLRLDQVNFICLERSNQHHSELGVVDLSRISGCLVTSGCCVASAADEKWYSPKRPSSTVAFQHSMQRHVSTIFDLYIYVLYIHMYIHSSSRGSAYKHTTTSRRITSRSHITALPCSVKQALAISPSPTTQVLIQLRMYVWQVCRYVLEKPQQHTCQTGTHTHKQGMHFTPHTEGCWSRLAIHWQ